MTSLAHAPENERCTCAFCDDVGHEELDGLCGFCAEFCGVLREEATRADVGMDAMLRWKAHAARLHYTPLAEKTGVDVATLLRAERRGEIVRVCRLLEEEESMHARFLDRCADPLS